MSRVLLTYLIVFSAWISFGQTNSWNPFVNQGIVSPDPLLPAEFGGTGVLSFNVGNTGSSTLTLVADQELQLRITLSKGIPDNVNPLSALGGTWVSYFNWTYEVATRTYYAIQNQAIPGNSIGNITIAYKVTENTAIGSPSNGFNVNLQPPSYAVGINTTDDDQVSSYTYVRARDYGDAPLSYGSVYHEINVMKDPTNSYYLNYMYMGNAVDPEPDYLASAQADGDDLNGINDEDGVTIPVLTAGTTVNIPVSVTIVDGDQSLASGRLNAWFDWNGDGDFLDAGEWVASNVAIDYFSLGNSTSGTVNLSVNVPSNVTVTTTFARFRFGNPATSPTSIPSFSYGEVEDYIVYLNCTPPAIPLAQLTQPTCIVPTGTITVTAPVGATLQYSKDGTIWQSGTVFSGLVPDASYTIYVRNNATDPTCLSSGVFVIQAIPAPPVAASVSLVQPTCVTATGSITVTAPLGAGLTYSIDGTNYQASALFSGLAPGPYIVTVKNSAGCVSGNTSATINAQPPLPAAPQISLVQPTCETGAGVITVTSPLGAGLSYSINGSTYQSSPTFTGVASGGYDVTVRNTDFCVSQATGAVINSVPGLPGLPVVEVVQPDCQTTTGSITVTSPSGPGFTYSIDGGTYQVSNQFTGLISGGYLVTAKNAAGCISGGQLVVINTSPSAPSAPVVSITQPTCAVATGTITITSPTGAGLTYSINGATYQASATFSGVAPGSYSVTVKSSAGCVSTATAAVINAVPDSPVAPVIVLTQPTCTVSTGTITITSPTGDGLTYSINGTTYQAATTFIGVAPGSYSVTVKNGEGCVSDATAAVINAAPATPAAPGLVFTQPTCTVATGTITVSSPIGAGLTYSINGTAYQASPTFSGVAAGSYSVTVKNSAGCVSTATAAVINAAPDSPAAPVVALIQPTCTVATGTVTVTSPTGAGLTYSISGTTYQASATFSGVAPGSYSVTVKNSAGCVSDATAAVINAAPATPAAPVVALTQPTCTVATGTVTVSSPTGAGLTYSINGTTYQAATTFSGVAPGSYSVTVKNSDGCVSTATAAVINAAPDSPAAPVVALIQPTCSVATGTITVTSPTGAGLTYSINGTTYQASPTFSGVAAESYSVTVKNSAGCVSTATAAVINAAPAIPAAPVVALIQPTSTVPTGTVFISSPTGAGLTYSIDGTTYQASATFSDLSPGSYSVTVKNSAGCVSTATAAVINTAPFGPVPPVPPAAPVIVLIQPTCTMATGTITATSPTGAGLTYSIDGTTYQASATFSGVAPGSYSVTVKNIDGYVSTATEAVINAAPATPVAPVVALTQPTCTVATGTITVTSPAGAGLTYSISGTTYQASATFSNLAPGSYSVTVKNSDGCFSEIVYAVITPSACPDITITKSADKTVYDADGEIVTYSIRVTNTGNTLLTDVRVTDPLTALNFTVASLLPGAYLDFTEKYAITLADLQRGTLLNKAFVTGKAPDGSTISDEAGVGLTGIYNPMLEVIKEALNTSGTVSVGETVTFMIRVVNTGNVPIANVSVMDPLTGMDHSISMLLPGVSQTFYTDYVITPADEAVGRVNNTAIVRGSGLRTDVISNNDTATVQVDPCELVIPNGFSPNGDGIQDFWRIKCIEKYPDARVEIYNRWGNLVYELDHYGNLDVHGPTEAWWNGHSTSKWTFGTEKLPTGTYFYILDLRDGSKPENGFIFLNR